MIKINGHTLPSKLEELIKSDNWVLPDNITQLELITGFQNVKDLMFMNPELMKKNSDEIQNYYAEGDGDLFGIYSTNIQQNQSELVDFIAYENIVLIAATYSDDYISLVYSHDKSEPSVYISNWETNKCRWKKIADSFDDFYSNICIRAN